MATERNIQVASPEEIFAEHGISFETAKAVSLHPLGLTLAYILAQNPTDRFTTTQLQNLLVSSQEPIANEETQRRTSRTEDLQTQDTSATEEFGWRGISRAAISFHLDTLVEYGLARKITTRPQAGKRVTNSYQTILSSRSMQDKALIPHRKVVLDHVVPAALNDIYGGNFQAQRYLYELSENSSTKERSLKRRLAILLCLLGNTETDGQALSPVQLANALGYPREEVYEDIRFLSESGKVEFPTHRAENLIPRYVVSDDITKSANDIARLRQLLPEPQQKGYSQKLLDHLRMILAKAKGQITTVTICNQLVKMDPYYQTAYTNDNLRTQIRTLFGQWTKLPHRPLTRILEGEERQDNPTPVAYMTPAQREAALETRNYLLSLTNPSHTFSLDDPTVFTSVMNIARVYTQKERVGDVTTRVIDCLVTRTINGQSTTRADLIRELHVAAEQISKARDVLLRKGIITLSRHRLGTSALYLRLNPHHPQALQLVEQHPQLVLSMLSELLPQFAGNLRNIQNTLSSSESIAIGSDGQIAALGDQQIKELLGSSQRPLAIDVTIQRARNNSLIVVDRAKALSQAIPTSPLANNVQVRLLILKNIPQNLSYDVYTTETATFNETRYYWEGQENGNIKLFVDSLANLLLLMHLQSKRQPPSFDPACRKLAELWVKSIGTNLGIKRRRA